MEYRFYSPVQGIIDYDFNKDMDYDSYFDEEAMELVDQGINPISFPGQPPYHRWKAPALCRRQQDNPCIRHRHP